MKINIWNKKIPTLLALLLITIGVGLTSFLVKNGAIFTGFAGPSNEPRDVRISNVADNSFTVSFITDDSVLGSINFGEDENLGQTAIDERNENAENISPHKVHSITARNLSPQATYVFSITSGANTYLNNGALYRVTTGPAIEIPSEEKTVSGKILLPDGTTPPEAIVYATADGGQIISTLSKTNGEYSIPISLMRTSDLTSFLNLEFVNLKILVSAPTLKSDITLSPEDIKNIPTIILSNDYDFTVDKEPIPQTGTPSASLGFPVLTSSEIAVGAAEPAILTPREEQEFTDANPLFQGRALPNEEVEITIHSNGDIKQIVVANAAGNWSFRPKEELSPGQHTITIKTRDKAGILKTITQSFTVFAAGTQVTETATPSATPTTTPTPTTTITPTATPIPTALTPTPTITITPTITPTPTSSFELSGEPGSYSAVAGAMFGLSVLGLGVFLLLLARGRLSSYVE